VSDPKPLSAAQVVPFLRSVVASGERLTPQDVAAIRDALDAGVRVEPAPEPTCRFCGAAIERDGPDWMHVVPVPGHLPEHDPKPTPSAGPEDWHHRCDIAACNCGRCHQCGEDMPDPMDGLARSDAP
jgi:hypothetical protein